SGVYSLNDSGSVGTIAYSHTDDWSESTILSEAGGYQTPAPTYPPPAGAGWNFTRYYSFTNFSEVTTDQVGDNSGACTLTSSTTVTGSGTSGTMVQTFAGSYSWNGRSYSFGPVTITTTVTLQGPRMAPLGPEVGTTAWLADASLRMAVAATLLA